MTTISQIAAFNYPNSTRKRMKFFLRVLLHGKKHMTNMSHIFNDPKLKRIIVETPNQYTKIFHPYLYRGLRLRDRIQWMKNHYDFLKKHWNTKLIHAVYHTPWLPLAQMQGDKESSFSIALQKGCGTRYGNEGEMLIALFCEEKIISMCFNFMKDANGDYGIFIGCMQGPCKKTFADPKEIIKSSTKKMFGMRPQAVLTYALTVIASAFNLKHIYAVNTASHIKRKRLKTNLDVFWADLGGNPVNPIAYSIPLTYQRKPIEEIPANKRNMYRKRYAMLDAMEKSIRSSMGVQQ